MPNPSELERQEQPGIDREKVLFVIRVLRNRGWDECTKNVEQLLAENDRLKADLEARQKFKDWVHGFLDGVGVPADPDPEHTKEHGCRISGRMRYLTDQIDRLRDALQDIRDEAIADCPHIGYCPCEDKLDTIKERAKAVLHG